MRNLSYNESEMKLIFAQGNPGVEYEKTRHNIGFLALDFYAAQHDINFQTKQKFNAEIAEYRKGDERAIFVKPLTYYNDTGVCARALTDFYKIKTTDVLVVHDELALPFGTLRTRNKGSSAGNKGVQSLNNHLGEDYHRLRIGTWNELADQASSYDFVLSKFTSEESEKLQKAIFPKTDEIIDNFIDGSRSSTSHKV